MSIIKLIIPVAISTALLSSCSSGLSFRLAAQCDFDRNTREECLERNARTAQEQQRTRDRELDERR